MTQVSTTVTEAAAAHHPRALRWAVFVVLPYLILGLVWVFSNPPDAAPDEHDHLIKALGAGQFDVGVAYAGQPADQSLGALRNASISRTFTIPMRLLPGGFDCLAMHPERTGDCLPKTAPPDDGDVPATASVGSYPIFGYIPMGIVALRADSPGHAFLLARLISLLLSTVFLFLAAWQLARWLGRGALLGLALAITPMVVFSTAVVSTSGLEISTAIAVASIAVVVTRRPEALADRATLATLACAASALLLSRQLGVVTLALAAAVALTRGGGPVVWRQLRAGRPALIVTIAVVAISALVVLWWERSFDNPVNTVSVLSVFTSDAVGNYVDWSFGILQSGIGWFGWADTQLPGPAIALWIVATVVVIGGAAVIGRSQDSWTLLLVLLYAVVVGFVVQATVFAPVQGGVQGRHLLPVFSLLPILAGVVMNERLSGELGGRPRRRLYVFVAVVAATMQLFSIVFNSHRYAVGEDGPVWFLGSEQWAPRFGWLPWLLLAAVASIGLAVVLIRSGREPQPRLIGEPGLAPEAEVTHPDVGTGTLSLK